jgi:hypothetical protein
MAVLMLGLYGCRQSDGPMPTPTADQRNEIRDIAKDMINLTSKDQSAAADLANDVGKYIDEDEGAQHVASFTRDLAAVLSTARLDDQSAERLAHSIWIGLTATELSERQVQTVENDIERTLTSAGVASDKANAVAQQIGRIQEAITDNPKRWYQVF